MEIRRLCPWSHPHESMQNSNRTNTTLLNGSFLRDPQPYSTKTTPGCGIRSNLDSLQTKQKRYNCEMSHHSSGRIHHLKNKKTTYQLHYSRQLILFCKRKIQSLHSRPFYVLDTLVPSICSLSPEVGCISPGYQQLVGTVQEPLSTFLSGFILTGQMWILKQANQTLLME